VRAVASGTIAEMCSLVGVALLIYRRRVTCPGVHGDRMLDRVWRSDHEAQTHFLSTTPDHPLWTGR
jgi:hypothetical protein